MTPLRSLIDQLCAPGELPRSFSDDVLKALSANCIYFSESSPIPTLWKLPNGKVLKSPNLVESLDDQKAIMPEGWRWTVITFGEGGALCVLLLEDDGNGNPRAVFGHAPTEERARLAAILKAWLYEQGDEE